MLRALRGDIKLGFNDYGIRFLPRLLAFPFMVVALVVLTLLQEVVRH